MVPNWKTWCRLCAREDPTKIHINIYLKNEVESAYLDAISKHFAIDITLDNWPQTMCTQCYQYVTDLISFSQKTSKVQSMFAELFNNHAEAEPDLKELRAKYELQGLELKNNINIGEFEFIDEDMLSIPLIKTENIDKEEEDEDEESVVSDKEWQPEKDDDSSSDDESTTVTIKCKKEDADNSEETQKTPKRGRPKQKPETCSTCQKQFTSYKKYTNHMKEDHGVTIESPSFNCSKCNKSYPSKKSCSKHEKTHDSPEPKYITCPYCNQEFPKNKLRKHIREMHVGERPYVCDCGKAYTTFGNLKEHKSTHSEDRPFKCRYCEKGFKNKSRLRTHEDTHNDTNYICTSCGLQLNTRRTLNMHMLVHSDQKQHKCDLCGKEYKRAKNLKIHLIAHAGLKSYMCTFCDKTFTCNANCRLHMKRHHPIELAAMEATGTKLKNANIPKMEDLRAVISKKSIEPMGSMEFGSTTTGVVPMGGDLKSLGDDSQATMLTLKEEQTIHQQQQNAYFIHNRMGFGQLHES